MTNETDRSTKNEEGVQGTDGKILGSLLGSESTRAAHQIAEACSDGSVDVEDKGLCVIRSARASMRFGICSAYILLGRSDLLGSNSVVEGLGAGELLLGESLDELDSEIWVVDALDLVSDTRDWENEVS